MKQTVKVRAALAILAALALVGCSHPQPAEAQDWYTATGVPSTGSLASSAAMRGEFQLIQNAFGRLPALSGHNNEAIFVNAGGTALEAVDAATVRDRLGLELGTDVQAYDADLAALAGLSSTGIIARTGSGTAAVRSITTTGAGLSATNGDGVSANPAISLADDVAAIEALNSTGFPVRTGSNTWTQRSIAVSGDGLSISNGNGVSGAPTLSVANDLAAIEALSTTGLAARTGTSTWAARTLSVSGAGLSVSNGNGVSGNPTISAADDLAALEALSSTGCAARTGTSAWNVRTITGTSNEISVTNGDCVSGNPTLSLPSALTFTGKTVTGGTFDEPEITDAEISGGTIDNAAIGGTTPASGSFTDITVNSSPSEIFLVNPSGGTNNKRWRIAGLNNGNFQIGTVSDAGVFTTEIFRIQRSGTSANGIIINSAVQAAGITDSNPGTSNSSVVTIAGTQTLTNKGLTSPTISGGTINNAAIGGTTPAAGAFTTLSATGRITHTKSCASGFTRVMPGMCLKSPTTSHSWNTLTTGCQTISSPPGSENVTALLIEGKVSVKAENGATNTAGARIAAFQTTGTCVGAGGVKYDYMTVAYAGGHQTEADGTSELATGEVLVTVGGGPAFIPVNGSGNVILGLLGDPDSRTSNDYVEGSYRIVGYLDN